MSLPSKPRHDRLDPTALTPPELALVERCIGLDIGGTKCAVSRWREGRVEEVVRVPTTDFKSTWRTLCRAMDAMMSDQPPLFGISCGGPLNPPAGKILTPPNLSEDWHHCPLAGKLTTRYGGEAVLMNDANACALAEHRFGAGRRASHLVFLTSGTGMGAGIITDGRLLSGITGDAGEIGHVRLQPDGPVGYGKAGSIEGCTSGGSIPQLARELLERHHEPPPWWSEGLSTAQLASHAKAGDPFAISLFQTVGEHLGAAIAVLVDLLNPERIILGGYYPKCRDLLEPALHRVLRQEALPRPVEHCRILPAQLGESIGSHGAIAAALYSAFIPSPCPKTSSLN